MASKEDKGATGCRNIAISETCPATMRKRDVWRIEQFNLLKKVGSGYASTVYMATCRQSGNQVAIKLYHKNKLSELNFFQVSREIQIHTRLSHKNIIQLWAAFEDQFGIYLVSEFAGKGDVFSDLERRGGHMTETDAVRQVLHPFLQSLVYLHGIKVMHRDIKPENLLFSSTGILKVADFGLSIDFEHEHPVTRVGTLDYMAPEVVTCPDKHKPTDHKDRKDLRYTPVADAWAVGVLAYELTTGRPPFDRGNKKATIAEIVNGTPQIPPTLSEGCASFIKYSLTKDKKSRPTCQQLLEHPWIVSQMTIAKAAPKRRGGIDAVLELGKRADSFIDPRMMGMSAAAIMAEDEDYSEDSYEPDELVHNLQLKGVHKNGGLLGAPRSMSVTDNIRWRDIAFNAEPGHGGGYLGGPGAAGPLCGAGPITGRRSDGEDSRPGSRRASYARASRSGTAQGPPGSPGSPMSRAGSQNVYESSDSYGARPMSREELLAAAGVGSRPGSFSRSGNGAAPVLAPLPSSPGRSMPGVVQASPRSFTTRFGTSASGVPGAPAPAAGVLSGAPIPPMSVSMNGVGGVQRSPLSAAGGQMLRPSNPSTPTRQPSLQPRGLAVPGSPLSPARSIDNDAVLADLGRLQVGGEPPLSPSKSAGRPVQLKPTGLSSRAAGLNAPLTPSRMNTSFTAPGSPLAPVLSAGSRLARFDAGSGTGAGTSSPGGPTSGSPTGSARSSAAAGGPASPTSPAGMMRPSLSQLAGRPSSPLASGEELSPRGSGPKGGDLESPKGGTFLGGLKKVFNKPSP